MSHLFCKNYTLPITAMIFFGIENIQQLFVSLQKCCVIRNKKRLCISLKPWSASRNTIGKKKEKNLSPGFHPSFVQSCGSPVDTESGGKKAVTKFPPMVFTVLLITSRHSTLRHRNHPGQSLWATVFYITWKNQMHKPRFWEVTHSLAAE